MYLKNHQGTNYFGSNIFYKYSKSLGYHKRGKKENLTLKYIKLMQYDNKHVILITNLVKTTWLT